MGTSVNLFTLIKCHCMLSCNTEKVGTCLVTPPPHRLVGMGYNGMPDGRGFKDEHMPWGKDQPNYSNTFSVKTVF